MSRDVCATPLDLESLLGYWLGDLASDPLDAVEEHLMSCATCAEELDGLAAVGDGVRGLARAGAVLAVVSGAFVERLAGEGLRVREYRVADGESVECTIRATDDVVAARLAADLRGLSTVHLVQCDAAGIERRRISDIPLTASTEEVVVLEHTGRLRALPASVERIRLVTPEAGGERLVGEYTFVHTPAP